MYITESVHYYLITSQYHLHFVILYCNIFFIVYLYYSDNSTVEFMDFIYLSQVMQALCIRAQAEHYRRHISAEGVLTRGTLYWQLVITVS